MRMSAGLHCWPSLSHEHLLHQHRPSLHNHLPHYQPRRSCVSIDHHLLQYRCSAVSIPSTPNPPAKAPSQFTDSATCGSASDCAPPPRHQPQVWYSRVCSHAAAHPRRPVAPPTPPNSISSAHRRRRLRAAPTCRAAARPAQPLRARCTLPPPTLVSPASTQCQHG